MDILFPYPCSRISDCSSRLETCVKNIFCFILNFFLDRQSSSPKIFHLTFQNLRFGLSRDSRTKHIRCVTKFFKECSNGRKFLSKIYF